MSWGDMLWNCDYLPFFLQRVLWLGMSLLCKLALASSYPRSPPCHHTRLPTHSSCSRPEQYPSAAFPIAVTACINSTKDSRSALVAKGGRDQFPQSIKSTDPPLPIYDTLVTGMAFPPLDSSHCKPLSLLHYFPAGTLKCNWLEMGNEHIKIHNVEPS